MAAVRSKNGKLYIDFYYNGKRFKVYLKLKDNQQNRKFANLKLKELEKELMEASLGLKNEPDLHKIFPNEKKFQKQVEPENKKEETKIPTLNEYFNKFLKRKVHLAKSTIRTWTSFYNVYFKNYLGHKLVSEIKEEDLLPIIHILKQRVKPSVINKKLTVIRSIFKELHEDGIIDKNPFSKIKKLKNETKEINPFTEEELKTLLEGFKKYFPHYYNFVAFLAFTGCRPNEAVALKWKYIDWDNRKILIREGFVLGEFTSLKTASSKRDIDMTNNLYIILKDQFNKTYPINQEFVFINNLGRRICWENFRQKYHKVIKRTGLNPRPIYQLRHTFASLALKAGEDPTWVSKTLGHSSLKMTLEVYNRYIPSLNKDGKQINSVFSKIINSKEDKNE